MSAITTTNRTRVLRHPERGVYDIERIHAILDEGYLCHVGFTIEGQPYVIPTAYARSGDQMYIHGSAASRMLRSLAQGVAVCVTVTLVDGFVLARSAFHHSINYRSVVVYGAGEEITDLDEKQRALAIVLEHLVPGRAADARPPTSAELRATRVVRVPLAEASAKVRAGGPVD